MIVRSQDQIAGRNYYLDFVKGFAILLVEIGHSIQYGSGAEFLISEAFFSDWLFRFIYSFHMPLFMLVSGYVFYWSISRRKWYLALQKQFKGLVIPIVCWVLSYRLYLQVFDTVIRGNPFSWNWVIGLLNEIVCGHWFLWATFWCAALVIIIRQVAGDRIWVYAVLGAGLMFLPNQWIPNGDLYVFMYPYFVLGYFVNRYQLLDKFKNKGLMCILCVITFAVLFSRFTYDAYIYTTHISLLTETPLVQLMINGYRWLIGLVGSAMVLILLKWGYNGFASKFVWVQKMFISLGKNTLGLYVVSTYLNQEILLRVTGFVRPHHGLNFLAASMILLLAMGIVAVLHKFRWTRELYLGGR